MHDTGPRGDLSLSFAPETRTLKVCLTCGNDDDALVEGVFDGVYAPNDAWHQVAVVPDAELRDGRVFLFTVQGLWDGAQVACAFARARAAFLASSARDGNRGARAGASAEVDGDSAEDE
jgi:hypothetical protein